MPPEIGRGGKWDDIIVWPPLCKNYEKKLPGIRSGKVLRQPEIIDW